MKPRSYGPFPYSPIIDRPKLEWPGGAHVALWIIPNIEYFSMMEKPGRLWRRRQGSRRGDVGRARLRQPRRRVPHHGRARQATASAAPSRSTAISAPSTRASWRRARSASGSGWGTTRATPAASTRPGPARRRRSSSNTFATIEKATGKRPTGWLSSGLQETWDTLDHLVDNGCRICRRLVQRRPALPDDARRRPHHRVDALHPAAQRQVGDRAALRLGRRLQADDLRPVRRALPGGRQVRPRHGDRAASVSDRRAAPHRRLRCGAEVHLQAQEGLEGDRRGNCKPLSRPTGRQAVQHDTPSKRRAERRAAEKQERDDETVSKLRGGAADLSALCWRRRPSAPPTASRSARSARPRPTSGRSISASRRASSRPRTSRSTSSTCSRAPRWCSSSPPARSTSPCRPAWSIRSAPSTRRRADRDRPLRGAGAALCAARQAGHQEARGSQGQGDLGRRPQGHHPHLSSSACWRRTASSPASSTWSSRARPRRAAPALLAGAVDAAILTPPFNFQAEAEGFTNLGLTRRLYVGHAVLRHRGEHALGRRPSGYRAEGCIDVYNQEHRLVLRRQATATRRSQILMKVSKI